MKKEINAQGNIHQSRESRYQTYIGAHGIAAAKLCVSKNVLDKINDLTRLGRC